MEWTSPCPGEDRGFKSHILGQMETITVTLDGCARCGHEHTSEYKRFKNPIVIGNLVYTYWSLCPNTGEPKILMIPDEFIKDELQLSKINNVS